MTAHTAATATHPAARPAAVDQQLARATAALCRDHPARAAAVRGVLAPLRDRLHRVHAGCQAADATAWAAYTADLDRGLDELSVEVARAAEQPASSPALDDVLVAAAVRLEARAWQLRLTTLGAEGRDVTAAQQLADALDHRLEQPDATRADLARHLADLRLSVLTADRD